MKNFQKKATAVQSVLSKYGAKCFTWTPKTAVSAVVLANGPRITTAEAKKILNAFYLLGGPTDYLSMHKMKGGKFLVCPPRSGR